MTTKHATDTQLVVQAWRPGEKQTVTLQFSELKLFSHGVYSNVYTGVVTANGYQQLVAIKKCWSFDEDSKEVRILKRLNRFKAKNIVHLLFVYSKKYDDKVCYSLVLNFMPMSLSAHIRSTKPNPLDLIETKLFTWQMFRGLNWMHRNDVIHRDFKPQNILINPDTWLLQIADFGSSIVGEYDSVTSYHVTRYYRPPELLLGSYKHSTFIDIWSAGCVFAEMLRGQTFLAGKTSKNQLEKILQCFGPPTTSQLQAMHARRVRLLKRPTMVDAIKTYNERKRSGLVLLIPKAPNQAIQLLEKIFRYSPRERLCGPKLLANPFFDDIFDSELQHNGKPLNLLTRADLAQAVAEDLPSGVDVGTMESHTGGSAEPAK